MEVGSAAKPALCLTQALQDRSAHSKGAGLESWGDGFSSCLHFRIENPMPGLKSGAGSRESFSVGMLPGQILK